jgi:transposase InsO family protein
MLQNTIQQTGEKVSVVKNHAVLGVAGAAAMAQQYAGALEDAIAKDVDGRRLLSRAKCNRRMFRYKSQRITDDGPLRKRLEELAAERRRFGYRRLHVMIRRDGWIVNIKRLRRIYREAIYRSESAFGVALLWDGVIQLPW